MSKEQIHVFSRDGSMDGVVEELELIPKELKSIGNNINQQTLYFNACKSTAEKPSVGFGEFMAGGAVSEAVWKEGAGF